MSKQDLQYSTAYTNPVTIDGEDLEDVKTLTYLGSIIAKHGGFDADIKTYMERSNNVGNREDQPNSNGNEEIQLGSTGNQRNLLDPSWTTKAKYGEDAAVFRSRRGEWPIHSWSCSNAVQSSTKCTCGAIFPHKRIHKATWISPDHATENQIDHICINKKFRRTMEDVRTRRGADVTSDHHLVVANLKLKLKKNWTSGQTALQRFNTAFLRDTDKLNEFKIALNNRFQALHDLRKEEETSMEDNWKGIKEALTSTCQEVLGLKKYHHKEWISTETLDKIKEMKNKKAAINNSRTRAEKVQAQAEYIEANKQVKRSIRADKKKYVEELATTAEKAAREGNMKQLYDTTKKLAGKYNQIATLRIIVEQSVEWNSSLYINLIDYEKAFDSVDKRTLWKLLRHYGVPEKIVNITRNSYDGLQCKVVHGGQLTDALVVDWIMRTSTSEGKHGIQWTARSQLDDLDFADDLALLSHTHEQMQMKTASVAAVSASVGLSIHKGKTKVLKFKAENNNPITLDGETLENVESFTYLGSIIDEPCC
ncbi:unnamed protein product [Schistosoma margrebowiei]|uniref:Reverse transcriptase domain-containing protein n=1 Tax=Schistosoma margrebowiei TaxID=48269 RepID=A0A183MZI4_9TREM|nr:unnamed protein product [Schistosoma margrebowiei]